MPMEPLSDSKPEAAPTPLADAVVHATANATDRAAEDASTNGLQGAALERVLRDAVAGDARAWEQLVASFAPRIHGLVRAHVTDTDLAMEIVQSTFTTVATKLAGYVESGRFEPWIFRIAMNRLRDELRRRKRHAKPMDQNFFEGARKVGGSDAVEVAGAAMDRAITADRLQAALAQLNETDREIVDLRHFGGMSFKELTEHFKEPLGTLLARHHRALRKLRGLLEGLGVDDV
ncbi:MAG: sigma-70 family RNA polymerase sigma factor [Phycisphaerales bacterium]|nr:sigma-70 family RNA polymerase sigma factor [Phycisphaerales bacterium]